MADQAGADLDGTAARRVPSRRPAIIILCVVSVAAFVLDLVTKQIVVAHLREGEPVRWLGGAVYLVYIRNGGAAFSFGTGYTWIFPLITIAVIIAIVVLARRLRSVAWAVSFGLVLGGALGNLGDRLFREPGPMRGHVVDFLSLFSNDGHGFAIFNVADSALSCGVVLAILLELLGRHRDGTRMSAADKSTGGPAGDPVATGPLTAGPGAAESVAAPPVEESDNARLTG